MAFNTKTSMFEEMIMNPALLTDGYKFCHKDQYPKGITWAYETWTPRKSRIPGVTHAVVFGIQGALATMYWDWKKNFFDKPYEEVEAKIKDNIEGIFSATNPEMVENYDYTPFKILHDIGHLPIKIKAVPEGTFLQIGGEFTFDGKKVRKAGLPMFTIESTDDRMFWFVGYLETYLSCMIWQSMTAATIADKYKRILTKYANLTGCNQPGKVFMQGGDFSMRGMGAPEASYRATAGHLTSFGVSATVPAREYLMNYYGAPSNVISYAPSTEHSVMCSWGKDEVTAFTKLLTEVYPSGTVTIVCDTWDFWNVIDNVLPAIKDIILSRNGKLNIRPDSGDPVKIVCGDPEAADETVRKGLIVRLSEIFGYEENEKGYKRLPKQIGAVYGDSITPERAEEICKGLMESGFESVSCALGIGSFTYQFVTRDTLGFALKATAEMQNGQFKPIYKDPKTDTDKFKKSQKGLVAVVYSNDKEDYTLIDNLTPEQYEKLEGVNELKTVFENGHFVRIQTFDGIRMRVAMESERVYHGEV